MAGRMAQQVKHLMYKPEDPSAASEPTKGRRRESIQSWPLTATIVVMNRHALMPYMYI